MKAKKAAALRARIVALLETWHTPLGLSDWHKTIVHHNTRREFVEAGGTKNGAMMCTCAWEYQSVHIETNLAHCARLDAADLELAVVHELCHALVNELREKDKRGKHEERVVTALTNAFIWTRNAAQRGELNTDAQT